MFKLSEQVEIILKRIKSSILYKTRNEKSAFEKGIQIASIEVSSYYRKIIVEMTEKAFNEGVDYGVNAVNVDVEFGYNEYFKKYLNNNL